MKKRIELAPGTKFGRWTVIESAGSKRTTRGSVAALWKVRCECGTERIVPGFSLRNGSSKSCGCSHRRPHLRQGQASFNAALRHYKRNADERHLPWELSEEQFSFIVGQDCHYCGAPPSNVTYNRPRKPWYTPFVYNGIDRRDNNLGYSAANCVPCCKICNIMKMDMGYEQFVAQILRIAERSVECQFSQRQPTEP